MSYAAPANHGKRKMFKAMSVIGAASLAVFLSVRSSTGQDAPATQPATPARPVVATPAPAAQPLVGRGTAEDGTVRVMLNKSAVLQTRMPYKRVSVAQPEVADVNPIGPTTLLVTAKKIGSTQIIVWDDQDRSQVMDVTVGFDLQELQDQLTKQFPGAKIEASTTGNNVMLKGRVPSIQVAEQAKMIAGGYSENVMNFLEVSGGQQVMLQVKFAEVSKTAANELGVNLGFQDGTSIIGSNSGGGAPFGFGTDDNGIINRADLADPTRSTGSLFGTGRVGNTAFGYLVQALRQNNLLRVLAEPNLVTMSGQKASFLAGGEFPVPVPQESGEGGSSITVEYKEFGVRLNFTPYVLGDGRIRLEVSPEVSDLDFTNAVVLNGFRIPALTTRNVKTTVEMTEGQTLAIAGLLNNRVSSSKDAIPLLGDIPVLGALFRSTRYERRETELVVLVSPVLVEAMNPDQVPALPGQAWRHPHEVDALLMGDIGGPAEVEADKPAPLYQGRHGFVPAAGSAPVAATEPAAAE